MKPEDFDYALPEELIAQAPAARRDAARLLRLGRGTARVEHLGVPDLLKLLRPGDLLVLNDTRTIPARLLGRKVGTGGRAELLLVRPWGGGAPWAALEAPAAGQEWRCLGQASKGLRAGTRVGFEAGGEAEVLEALGEGEVRVRFQGDAPRMLDWLQRAGALPLPPYIERSPGALDQERYQTVFGRLAGSVAAPTAGLHFTPELLAALEAKGVRRAFVTLDVGPGTFLPVREDDLSKHRMHAERCEVSAATAAAIADTRAAGGRVVAVGTTVVRTLESRVDGGEVQPGEGDTRLFITPGFRFQVVQALLTNFHLPRSTLLMLVSAFAGRDAVLAAYAEAVRERYRFFSYGDAMFIEDDA